MNLQVLSNSVAEALSLEDKPHLKETERFVRNFNRFFDLLNVWSLTEHINQRKPDLKPYRDVEDERLKVKNAIANAWFNVHTFQWLQKDFLNYLDEW